MSFTVDADVLALFETEAAERLGRIGDLLLDLEVAGPEPDLVAALFREAHTLKGAAVVVGLDELAAEAHALEELLSPVRDGAVLLTPDLVGELLDTVDRLQALARCPLPTGIAEEHPLPGDARPAGPAASTGPATARVAVARLDELVRLAGESAAAHQRLSERVTDHLGPSDPYAVPEIRSLARLLTELQEATLQARMLPVDAMAGALRRAARDAARRSGKEVRCEVRGGATELDRTVHERLADALIHLVRNAVDHGIEDPHSRLSAGKPEYGTVVVHAMQLGSRVIITVTDDGRGVDVDAVRRRARALGVPTEHLSDADVHRVLFRAGLSTAATVTDLSGRGVGLDAVREVLDGLRGRVDVESTPGAGARFRISVPITLTVLPSVLVAAAGHRYAIGLANVVSILPGTTPEVTVEGGTAIRVGEKVIPVTTLAAELGCADEDGSGCRPGPVLVLTGLSGTHAFRVDEVAGQREVLVSAMPALVPAHDLVVGASAEPDGTAMLVLDADGLVEHAEADGPRRPVPPGSSRATGHDLRPATAGNGGRGAILVVDDALTVRELQRSILTRAGFVVRTAGDGDEAVRALEEASFDLVLTDVEMPGLDGLALTRAIRAEPRWMHLPVVVVTSRSTEEDRREGMEAGADAYIVKTSFDEAGLLRAVDGLLGNRTVGR